jgi:hypothetical protein
MNVRKLRRDEVKFRYSIEPDSWPFKGNVLASGVEEDDKEAEDEVRRRLEANDILAWCISKCTAYWVSPSGEIHYGTSMLGGCSYAPDTTMEEIVEDMGLEEEALDSLMDGLEHITRAAKHIQEVLGPYEEKEQHGSDHRVDSGHSDTVVDHLEDTERVQQQEGT